ncbi:hypothetical protein D3C81_1017900 [compost metagenome]
MGGDALLLLDDAGIVHDHRDTEGNHEENRHRQQARDERAHQDDGQRAVEPQQVRAAGVRMLGNTDVGHRHVVGGQVQFAEAGALAFAVDPGEGEDRRDASEHGRDHRHEDIRRIDMQRAGRTGGGAAPGRHVQHAAGEHDQAGHQQRAHAQSAVQRQYGGHADHVGGRAVAIQRDDHRQRGGAHRDFQRIALHQAKDPAHRRVEQAGVDHQGEVEDGEHQHHPGGGEGADAVEHHRAEAGGETAEYAEGDGDQDQGDQRGQALGHDQEHEGRHHGEGEQSQHVDNSVKRRTTGTVSGCCG